MAVEYLQSPQASRRVAYKGGTLVTIIIGTFLVGWVTFAFSLFDVGRFSITLLWLASFALALSGFRFPRYALVVGIWLLCGTLLAWLISFAKYPEDERTYTHLLQSLLAIGVMLGASAIDWDRYLSALRKTVATIGIIVFIFGIYQIAAREFSLPLDFLPITNQQLAAEEGLQRGYTVIFEGGGLFTRVSSFMPEPSDLGRFMLWVFAVGYACRARRQRFVIMGVGAAGILLSQSMGALVGLVFLVSAVLFLKRDTRGFAVAVVLVLTGIGVFAYCAPDEARNISERAARIITERQSYLDQTKRFGSHRDNMEVFRESPLLGHGIGTLTKVKRPDAVVSSSFMFNLIERGIIGSFLFYLPFFWVFFRLLRSSSKQDEITQTALFVLIVELYCFWTFATVYFPPLYFALGFAVSRLTLPRATEAKQFGRVACNNGTVLASSSKEGA